MQFIIVIIVLFLLYQYWQKRQDIPRVKRTRRSKGDVIDISTVKHEDIERGDLPYKRVAYLQDRSQRLMYEGLKEYLRYYAVEIFPQVDMLKLLYVPQAARNFMAYVNRLLGKTADFVICDAQTLEPLVVIALDRMSGDFARQRENNLFIDRAFKQAGLPLVRLMASEDAYNWEEIVTLLHPYLAERMKN